MKLTDHLPKALIKVPLAAADKTQAITQLVDLIVEQGHTEKRDALLQAILEREAQKTTGIGRGFAIPHAKTDAVKKIVIAFGRSAEPIDFAAIDGQPVSLIALLVSPIDATSTHIGVLTCLSRLVSNRNVLNSLLSAADADEVYEIISSNDQDT